MSLLRSPIANWMPAKKLRLRKLNPWGLVVHTTGLGIVARAWRNNVNPIDLALDWYRKKSGVHYVIDYDGTIYQMLGDDQRGAHVGISLLERTSYLLGGWRTSKKLSNAARRLWSKRWPGYKSPQHLYPTRSPNSCYIGVELLPLTGRRGDGLWFTDAQHAAVRALALDLAKRHRWPDGWMETPRLVGHEDLDAFARWDNLGGWDPGAMRSKPRFDWSRVVS